MSLNSLLFQGSTPIGALVIGLLADLNGVQAATAELGAACAVGVAVSLIYYRRFRDRMAPDTIPVDYSEAIEVAAEPEISSPAATASSAPELSS